MDLEIKNLMTDKSINFKTDENYIVQELDFGQVKRQSNTTKYINLIGYSVDSTTAEPRDIVIKGFIIKNVKESKKLLNELINPLHNLVIRKGDYVIEVKPDMSIKYGIGYEINNSQICQFIISATAYMPLFKKINEEEAYYSESLKLPLFPLKIPPAGIAFGAKSELDTTNINNQGDVDAGFMVRFIAEKGTVTNPKITNRKTGEYIEIIIDMAKGDVVELSTVAGNKYVEFVRGNTKTDIFKMVSKKSTMSMKLNTGINDIFISAAKNKANLNTVIKFTPLFLEVQ